MPSLLSAPLLCSGRSQGGRVPVWHPHDHVVHSVLTGLVNDGLEGGNQYLAAFQTKALLR